MDYEEIYNICKEIIEIHKQNFKRVKVEIDYLIRNKVKNEKYIEGKLDEMLDILSFYETDDTLLTFKKLCRYYYYINPQATADYIMFYKEQKEQDEKYYDENDIDTER